MKQILEIGQSNKDFISKILKYKNIIKNIIFSYKIININGLVLWLVNNNLELTCN